tara:strand:+ start:271 stop:972 length:702 start_codon:yes stop_codon:yes gene_type:complete
MNNIRNTMCRLSDLTNEQIDSLVEEMPYDLFFDFNRGEPCIGVTKRGRWGTWVSEDSPLIVTYTEMMQLLKGKNMNKQTAQEQMAVMQIEMDKLKAVIDKPEVKTGRVLNEVDLELRAEYWFVYAGVNRASMDNDAFDKTRIENGIAFHDKETAALYLEYLKLEQELRRAQAADGVSGLKCMRYTIALHDEDILINQVGSSHYAKISFNTEAARNAFRTAHTDEQLILLIRGV